MGEEQKTWKRIRIGIIIIVLVGAFLLYFTFTHTLQYLECKDIEKGIEKYIDYGEGERWCECNFISNICYGIFTQANYGDDCIDFSDRQKCTSTARNEQ